MRITLYKNCKLNNKYSDVFYNKTYLNGYLNTLSNVVVLDDDNVFSRNGDVLYIDDANIQDFKQYNYMKIEDDIGVFYAFINSIQWVNDIYIINYEEDVMSNYFEYVHIRNSLLVCNKSLGLYKGNNKRQISLYRFPINSEGNEYISVYKYTNETKIAVVVKLQLYKLNTAGEESERIPLCGVIGIRQINTSVTEYNLYNDDGTNPIDFFIQTLINKKGTQIINALGDNYYYDIDKIYAIPYDLIIANGVPVGDINTYFTLFNAFITSDYIFSPLFNENNSGVLKEVETIIPYDRKTDSVGLFTRPIKVINNGTNIKIKLVCYLKGYGFSVYLNTQNKIMDVTEDFSVDTPFTQASSSELQLQRFQRDFRVSQETNRIANENLNVKSARENAIINGIKSWSLGVSGIAEMGVGENSGGITAPSSALLGIGSSSINYEYSRLRSNTNIHTASLQIGMLNRAMYANSSIINNNFTYINALYNIVSFKINEDNTTQVLQAVKLNGYIVRELVGDIIQELDIENLSDNYEVFKFDEVNIYGIISQDYVRIIERVLTNGVRVWCKNEIGDII